MDATRQELFDNFGRVMEAARNLFHQKSSAYGFRNIAESGEEGVLIRLSDKFARLRNKGIPGEAIEDTLVDVINYAAILLLLRSGKWPGYQPDAEPRDLKHVLQVVEAAVHSISAPALEGDVGYDLRAAKDVLLPGQAHGPVYVPTGVRIKAPEGIWTRVVGRSSTTRRGVVVLEGVIDNAYTGEILAACLNVSGRDVEIVAGERVAQIICCPVITPKIALVEEFPKTGRGDKGFGSTGEAVGSSAAGSSTGGTS